MRLLYVEQAVPKAVVSSWVNSHTGGSSLTQANEALTELGVWQETSMPGGLPAWILKNTFRHNLKIVLLFQYLGFLDIYISNKMFCHNLYKIKLCALVCECTLLC